MRKKARHTVCWRYMWQFTKSINIICIHKYTYLLRHNVEVKLFLLLYMIANSDILFTRAIWDLQHICSCYIKTPNICHYVVEKVSLVLECVKWTHKAFKYGPHTDNYLLTQLFWNKIHENMLLAATANAWAAANGCSTVNAIYESRISRCKLIRARNNW